MSATELAPRSSRRAVRSRGRVLARYLDEQGRPHELVSLPGAEHSMLVVDRELRAQGRQWLVAHLAADEPNANARLICMAYLQSSPADRRCRTVLPRDWQSPPLQHPGERTPFRLADQPPLSAGGEGVRIDLVSAHMSIPALRWTRLDDAGGPARPISLRDAVAAEQSYEPFRTLTRRALAAHADDPEVSVTVLRAELDRVLASPIVLNRGLREAVLDHVRERRTSMSEIAIRCGRVKQDRGGRVNGETSWLARRIGLLPEARHKQPTPWVHSDVLGLIAREGLGISPREAEVG